MVNVSSFPFNDYEFLKKIFRGLITKQKVVEKDLTYDWVIISFSINKGL
jgi:hypothetical protein